jgi:phosphoglycerate dehydrogenase-like enzyme
MHILYAAPALPEYLARLHSRLSETDTFDVLPRITPEHPALARADVLIVLGAVTAETIAAARNLRLIQVLGAGYESVDLDAARSAGIPVATTGGANAVSVAEHTFALILALARRVTDSDRRIKLGDWPQLERYAGGVYELQGKTLGLIGLGHVGRAIARIARAFDMRLVYFARHQVPDEQAIPASYRSLEDLLRISDVVTVQVPLTPDTAGMIGAAELASMKPTAILVNTARGGIVDEMALAGAVADGRLTGVGSDVFAREPIEHNNPLLEPPASHGTVLTPHMAGAAQEAIDRTFEVVFENIRRLAAGQPLLNQV